MASEPDAVTEKTEPIPKIHLGALFDQIEERYGTLTPANVVTEAAREDHPLHERFEWDDSRAAELHRLNQARALLRLPRSTVVIEGCRIVSPSYVHDPSVGANKQGYVPIARIKSEQQQASDALDAELSRAAGALERAHGIAIALGDADSAGLIQAALKTIGRG